MEESAAIKNIVDVFCRLGCLLILRSSPDSVDWPCVEGARNQIV